MKIKSLTLNGFKSFANKTIINFQDGLTGIVGPNGSGKSNITEALRWVLGEQSVKNLRGSKMSDIIFAGSDTRAALNRAEVTLVLDNEDGYLYNQPNEIRITRRIFRSGDSEFFINEKKVRLKDVVDLFIDTGLGRESFSIISQGRVESIFNSKPQDRRILIEEVAGVLKYKKEKKKAESELVETTEHLKRVADILSELSRQRDPLAQQASKAKDYLSQKEQYDLLNRDRLVLEITQKSSEKEQKESELQKVIKILSDKERMTSEQSKQVEVLHSRQKKLESLIDNEQNELTELVRQEEKISGQQNMSRQEEKFQKERLSELQEQYSANLDNLTEIRTGKQSVKEKIANLEDDREKLSKKILELEKIIDNVKEPEEILEKLKSELNRKIQEKNLVNNSNNYIEQELEEKSQNQAETNKNIQNITNEKNKLKLQLDELKTTLNNKDNKYQEIVTTLKELKIKEVELSKKDSELKNNRNKAWDIYQRAQTKLETLKSISDSYTGYYQGAREVLKERKNISGIIGSVAEEFVIPKEYAQAMEVALGGHLQDIIVTDENVAKKVIQHLTYNRLGRATFLPQKTVKARMLNKQYRVTLESLDGYVGIASELVKVSKENLKVSQNLLGTTVIAKNIDFATEIAKKLNYGVRIVSLNGDVVNPGGAITGGAVKQKKSGLLEQKLQIEDLQSDIEVMKKKLEDMEIYWGKVQEEYKKIQDKIDTLQVKKNRLQTDRDKYRRKFELIKIENEHQSIKLKELKESSKYTNIEILSQNLEENKEKLHSLTKEIDSLEQLITQKAKAEEHNSYSIEKQREEISSYKQREAVIIEQLRGLKLQLQELMTQEENISELLKKQQDAIAEIKNKEKIALSAKEDIKDKQEYIRNTIDSIKKKLKDAQEERKQLHIEVKEAEKQLTRANELQRSAYEEQKKLSIRISQCDNILDRNLKDLSENYGVTFEEVEHQISEKDLNTIEKKLKLLKLGLDELGVVNIGAISEYERVNERYEFLNSQQNDLLSAKEQLEVSMNEMDLEVKNRFQKTFEQVSKAFSEVFPIMFSGGYAKLSLTNPENILETGIEIMAQPPGKKLQQLSLLSGGERALTAITLLFAILKVRPVPFVILDEAEAALDDTNVARYAQYLQKFDNETQFIVITHRKGTMINADILYGVTMQESGVSQIVSVALDDID